MRSMASSIPQERIMTVDPPLSTVVRKQLFIPAVWNSGAASRLTSSVRMSISISMLMEFHVMLPWVIITPLGWPVVPDVY